MGPRPVKGACGDAGDDLQGGGSRAAGEHRVLAVAELAIAGALVAWAPRLAAKLVPYAVLALAVDGLILAKAYRAGGQAHPAGA
jgi:hypothetical protein